MKTLSNQEGAVTQAPTVSNFLKKLELNDVKANGKRRKWNEKKHQTQQLAQIYKGVDMQKAERLENCASVMYFKRQENGLLKLHKTQFCRVRLCPMCIWRRGLKVFSQTTKILDKMKEQREYKYLLLTLTVKNVPGEELSQTITDMMKGWNRLSGYKAFDRAVKGFYRGLEVTHNLDEQSKDYNTYHPHFHCLLVVNKTYFEGKSYIKQEDWLAMWRKAMRLDYDPQVDVRRVQGNTSAAVAEVAKYAVKGSDYIIPESYELSQETVALLDKALNKRRLVSFGGQMKYWHKRLELDDPDKGDLVNTNNEPETNEGVTEVYSWNIGYNQYYRDK